MRRTTLEAPSLRSAIARLFRVLGDPTRLAILELLVEGPRTVSELVEAIGGSQSRVSNHLACLRWCRLVVDERSGRQVTYRIADPELRQVVADAGRLARKNRDHLATCRRIGPDWI